MNLVFAQLIGILWKLLCEILIDLNNLKKQIEIKSLRIIQKAESKKKNTFTFGQIHLGKLWTLLSS